MLRSLVPLVLIVGSARADTRQCHVFNNTDHEIGHMGILPGQSWWILPGTFKVQDQPGNQVIELTCDAKTPVVKLVGKRDAVTTVLLPTWLDLKLDDDTGRLTVSAKKTAAVVELDRAPLALEHGTATKVIDPRTMLLAADPRDTYAPDRRGWYLHMSFRATAGSEDAELMLTVSASKAGASLLDELRHAKTKPVPWAAAPDNAGPAIVSGCGFEGFVPLRDPSTLTAISLVALCEDRLVKVDTCPASNDKYFKGDPQIVRYRRDSAVELVEARTGNVIATTILEGKAPGPCRDTATKPIIGDEASRADVLAWLRTVK